MRDSGLSDPGNRECRWKDPALSLVGIFKVGRSSKSETMALIRSFADFQIGGASPIAPSE